MATQLKDEFFKDMGIDDFSEEEKVNFTDNFLQELNARVNMRLLDKLSEEQAQQLNKLIEQDDDKAIDDFRRSVMPDIDTVTAEEFASLQKEIKDENNNEAQNNTSADVQPAPVVNES